MEGLMKRKLIAALCGAAVMLCLLGCEKAEYDLILPFGFTSEKTAYAPGEAVIVRYGFIPTDTYIRFYSDADDLTEKYSEEEGFVFTFIMPDRDVTFWKETRNLSVYRPEIEYSEDDLAGKINEERMVFDYYEATVATVGGDSYTEFVLYEWDEDDLLLAKYSRQGSGKEICRICRVPSSCLYDCLITVNRNKMKTWKDGMALTGKIYAVRFRDGDQVIRISSDDMPEDGRSAFQQVGAVLQSAWSCYGPQLSA